MKKLITVLYVVFLILFSIFSYVFIDPNLIYLGGLYSDFAFSNRLLTTIFYVSSIIVFFIFYGIFIYLGVKNKISVREIFVLLGISIVILFFSYPAMLSYDIFNYIATSKVLFFYHENPYIIMPIEFTGEPFLFFMHAANKVALYGPFWILLTGIPYFFGLGKFIFTLFAFKALVITAYLLTVFLIWKMSKNILSLILFSFNPLIMIESVVSGHNDIVMMFLALFSYFLLAKRKIGLAILFIILSVLIKYSTLLLLPVFAYAFCKTIKKKEVKWKNIYYASTITMLIAFILSPLREEIYPWYAIWFLSFIFLIPKKKILTSISISLTLGLLFRYVGYMFSGTYFGITPLFKSIVTFTPTFLFILYIVFRKVCLKKSFPY